MLQTLKYFKLPAFLAPQSHGWITRVIEIEMNLFPWEMYHHTVTATTHIKLDVAVHGKSHRFSLMLPNLFAFFH
jgi:hypothetical protein